MRHGKITTEEAINILASEGVIYWTEEGYENDGGVNWGIVAESFKDHEIHTFNQGMKTRLIPKETLLK